VAKAESKALLSNGHSRSPASLKDEGCRVCRKDNDHANLLLCEACNAEYHLYCLNPPLQAVPLGDWYCGKCKPSRQQLAEPKRDYDIDGLDYMVSALPPLYTERFGEVVWAQGGPGFGWWPSYIYDPRMTVGGARDLARKHLGRRHLVYFFQCHEAPFAVLPDSKIMEWNEGLAENLHLGKVARHTGKNRSIMYDEAIKVAILELGKAIDHRMDWNHPDPNAILSPVKQSQSSTSDFVPSKQSRKRGRTARAKKLLPDLEIVNVLPSRTKNPTRSNLQAALSIQNATIQVDSELYCRIECQGINIGFVQLQSRRDATFVEARAEIMKLLEADLPQKWKFYVPTLGPVSFKQEDTLGPILLFVQQASVDPNLGDGSSRYPMKISIVEYKENEVLSGAAMEDCSD